MNNYKKHLCMADWREIENMDDGSYLPLPQNTSPPNPTPLPNCTSLYPKTPVELGESGMGPLSYEDIGEATWGPSLPRQWIRPLVWISASMQVWDFSNIVHSTDVGARLLRQVGQRGTQGSPTAVCNSRVLGLQSWKDHHSSLTS